MAANHPADFEDMIDENDPTWEFSEEEGPDAEGAFSDTNSMEEEMLFMMPGNKECRGVEWKIVKRGAITPTELEKLFKAWKKSDTKKSAFDWASLDTKPDPTIVERCLKTNGKQKEGTPPKLSLAAVEEDGKKCVVYEGADHGKFLVCSILGRMHGPPTVAAMSRKANATDDYNKDERLLESELGAAYPEKYGARLLTKDKRDKKEKKAGAAGPPPKLDGTARTDIATRPVAVSSKSTPKKQKTESTNAEPAGKAKTKSRLSAKAKAGPKEDAPAAKRESMPAAASAAAAAALAATSKPAEGCPLKTKSKAKVKAKPKRLFSEINEVADDKPANKVAEGVQIPIAHISKSMIKAKSETEFPKKKIKLLSDAVGHLTRALAAALEAHTL